MHFGLYLHRKGVVTAEQFVSALRIQVNNLVPIGQLALEEGILSARDIFTVLRLQSDQPHERFGDVAIELGLMRRDELTRLLMIQADRRRPLDEILVRQGVLTSEQARDELAAFRRDRLRSNRPVKKTIIHRPKAPVATRTSPAFAG